MGEPTKMAPQDPTQSEEYKKADEYLKKHHVLELMNDLCAAVCFHKPQDVRGFLLQELQMREQEGAEAGLFEDSEIDAVFGLVDLMQTGIISDTQCRTALLSLANSQKQKEDIEALTLPDEIDQTTFRDKAREVLRIQYI
mmetsp:Transcript_48872/g.116174  ORF Transcript_48872/g.116174 Transcript_48872/m.116174 type:complete len:140 (+) Transcript_48872:112-531(+)|eukprot:CAMPEP_0178427928 /NCGR_PEP_ID=MMETSP0689_2-20121128/30004_1 /TAXON_ID=160604 /ORGANISM="Amphidinium massartii, Strain CS-259" /LENGTH=139 /DNA_ID=CAMNT_0020049663 /DNA_START=18 /DNA_END=437 /DNA_ORIENTATION=+